MAPLQKIIRADMLILFSLLVFPSFGAQAHHGPPHLTLDAAVDTAFANYPSLRSAMAQQKSAQLERRLAYLAYLPSVDLLWQTNRASRNNVFGMMLPQSVIPSISGPVLGTRSLESVWGSAAGALLSFEVYDFGRRSALLKLADARGDQARAEVALTDVEVAATAGGAFLNALSAEQLVKSAESMVQRMQVFYESVSVLARNQLRPGADSMRAEAELAAARILLIDAKKGAEIGRAALAEASGYEAEAYWLDPGRLLEILPHKIESIQSVETTPVALKQFAILRSIQAERQAAGRSYFPRIVFQAAYYSRASGALLDGTIDSHKGIKPGTLNWGAGVTISLPIIDLPRMRTLHQIASQNVEMARAHYMETVLKMKKEMRMAESEFDAALRIAEQTPVQLKAARENQRTIRARYEAGLAMVVEVADGEQLLMRAEIQNAIAYLNAWRALFLLAKANGDLKPALQQVQ